MPGRLAVAVAGAVALAVASAAFAAETPAPTQPVYDGYGRLIDLPFVPHVDKPLLTEERATAILVGHDKVADWLARYPKKGRVTDATYDARTEAEFAEWEVKVWWGEAGQIALGRVDDETGLVHEAWTGPQVAWKMARGYDGAFGGKTINNPFVWLGFCAAFLIGLADFRRPLSLRNLDLVALLSFSVSLWFFNEGDIFTAMPLVYPGFAYLLARTLWIGIRGTRALPRMQPLWPVWVLAAAAVFAAGFRIGLNVQDSNVIDVGYAGVIGAHRISHGEAPYGHMPTQGDLKPCPGVTGDFEGETRERIQTNGRCESSNDRGDTYGPISYVAYLPGFWAFGWTGRWDDLPAAHATSILWDVLCLVGLALVGRRFGGNRLGATLAFAWATWPFTQYVSHSNTNDAIGPALLIWGFWLLTTPWARGAFAAFSGLTKFASLIVVPLWASYPSGLRRPREVLLFAGGFAAAALASFFVLLLEPDPLHAARVFFERTIGYQFDRDSPFSIWDWGQYHAAGLPDLHWAQRVLQGALLLGAVVLFFLPRRKSPLQLAALTGALLIGFEAVLTHWFYLYLPWFFPFVAFALLATVPAAVRARAPEPVREREARELVATG